MPRQRHDLDESDTLLPDLGFRSGKTWFADCDLIQSGHDLRRNLAQILASVFDDSLWLDAVTQASLAVGRPIPEAEMREWLENTAARILSLKPDRVLEIGCGEGRLTWRYASASLSTIGLDPDKDSLRVAAIDRPSDLDDKVHFTDAEAEHIPFNKEKFDIAILAWSL